MSNSNDLSHPVEIEDLQDEILEYRDDLNTMEQEAQDLRDCIATLHRTIAHKNQQMLSADSMLHRQGMTIESLRYQLKIARGEKV